MLRTETVKCSMVIILGQSTHGCFAVISSTLSSQFQSPTLANCPAICMYSVITW